LRVPPSVTVVEVGPRDGFQMEERFIPTKLKIEIIDALAAAGIPKIEATSFVSPRVIPQMADAREVITGLTRPSNTRFTALIPNLKGFARAVEAGVDGVRLVVCATETYNRRNVGLTIDQSVEMCGRIVREAEVTGTSVEAVIGVAFGCPFEGRVSEKRTLNLARRLAGIGLSELSVADSIGIANPLQMHRVMSKLVDELPQVSLSLHLHNTRGLGLANVLAALEAGITAFDASFGGLGGCPIMTGGTGNIATEDLVNMCEEMGISTNVDIAKVQTVSRGMEAFLERSLSSHVLSAGTPDQLYRSLR